MALASYGLEGYSGRLLEDEFVPLCRQGALVENTGFLGYEAAMETAMESQPDGWDPAEPDASEYPLSGNLHSLIAEELCPDDYAELELYTARGTAFDRYHGVDAFFRYRGETFTVDLTLNRRKLCYKADIVLQLSEGTEEELARYASEIARCLRVNSGAYELAAA